MNNLASIRTEKLGVLQSEMADILGVSERTVQNWEAADKPKPYQIAAYTLPALLDELRGILVKAKADNVTKQHLVALVTLAIEESK